MNALKTYYRVKREESDKAFEEKLKREKEKFELMSDEEKEEYLKSEAEKRKKLNDMLSIPLSFNIPYVGFDDFYK